MISNPLGSRRLAKKLLLELCPDYMEGMTAERQDSISKYFASFATEETITRISEQHDRYRKEGRSKPELKRPAPEETARYRMEIVDYISKTTGIEIPFSPELPCPMYENIANTLGI